MSASPVSFTIGDHKMHPEPHTSRHGCCQRCSRLPATSLPDQHNSLLPGLHFCPSLTLVCTYPAARHPFKKWIRPPCSSAQISSMTTLFTQKKSQVITKTNLQGSQVKVLPFLWLPLSFPPSPTRSSDTVQTGEGCISPGTPHWVNHRPGALFLRRELAILLTIQIRIACRVGRGRY